MFIEEDFGHTEETVSNSLETVEFEPVVVIEGTNSSMLRRYQLQLF